MRERDREHRNVVGGSKASAASIRAARNATVSAKHRTALEKRIERTWTASRKLGWSYSGFVTEMLGVLVILRQRERLEGENVHDPESPQDE